MGTGASAGVSTAIRQISHNELQAFLAELPADLRSKIVHVLNTKAAAEWSEFAADPGLGEGKCTLSTIRENYCPCRVLDYPTACQYMYWELDNVDGMVEGVYTGKQQMIKKSMNTAVMVSADGKQVDMKFEVLQNGCRVEVVNDGGKGRDCDAMDEAYASKAGINCEHVWPQSQLHQSSALEGISNLHHMFPCDVRANKFRGDCAFAEVDVSIAKWIKADRSAPHVKASEPGTASKFNKFLKTFEPRDVSKGKIARAMFYMAAMYGEQLFDGHDQADQFRDWWDRQKETLREWNKIDSPDQREVARTWNISRVQGRVNPFVVHPEWIDQAFFAYELAASAARAYVHNIVGICTND